MEHGGWAVGIDTTLLQDVYDDLRGKLGLVRSYDVSETERTTPPTAAAVVEPTAEPLEPNIEPIGARAGAGNRLLAAGFLVL